jgi:adenylate cyclase
LSEPSFWEKLKRRHVVKVGIAYVVVAAGVGGAADAFLPGLGAPEWMLPSVLGLLVLGLPVALVLAWAYELTPEGIVRDAPEEAAEEPEAQTVAPAAVSVEEERKSIVVLPFDNMSPDPNDAYFSDGLTEEIINALANASGLRVIARTSAFAFKGSNQDVREIGKQLGVGTVLEGSVRKAGHRLRITAQLIDAATGHHLWSERYDRDLEDVFAIQDEIGRIIAGRLQSDEKAAMRERPTDNLDAYEAYLRGQFYFAKGTADDYNRSVEHYKRATVLEPGFAEAYAGLARTYGNWALLTDPENLFPRAKEAALSALEVAPEMADAHAVLG